MTSNPRFQPTSVDNLSIGEKVVCGMLRRGLAGAFQRICWIGEIPIATGDHARIIYMNHHYYFDGHLIWLLAFRTLGRRPLVWMEKWDEIPFLSVLGAMPFPSDDARVRVNTIRRTSKLISQKPARDLYIFPEGRVHPPEDGILPFPDRNLERIDRLYKTKKSWVPLGIHMTSWGDPLPTLLLSAGTAHPSVDGTEQQRLTNVLECLKRPNPDPVYTLFERKKPSGNRWNFSVLAPLFKDKP